MLSIAWSIVTMSASLRGWVNSVMGGGTTGGAVAALLDEHVDAEQLDFGDELRSERPDPTGVGAQLKAHWRHTVREEVERQCAAMKVRAHCGRGAAFVGAQLKAH